MCMCCYTHPCEHLQSPDVDIQRFISNCSSPYSLQKNSLTEPRAYHFGQTGSRVTFQDPPVYGPSHQCCSYDLPHLSFASGESKFRSSSLCSRHLTHGAITLGLLRFPDACHVEWSDMDLSSALIRTFLMSKGVEHCFRRLLVICTSSSKNDLLAH